MTPLTLKARAQLNTCTGGCEKYFFESKSGLTPQPPSGAPNGFLALAEYDRPERGGNPDGLIDGRDAAYASLRLWQDADHDGVSAPGELHALGSLRVGSISLDYREVRRRDRYGNQFRYQAAVGGAGGGVRRRPAYDVLLVTGR